MKLFISIVVAGTFLAQSANAQSVDAIIKKGNDMYKVGKFKEAELLYRKALAKEPGNYKAKFNLGNTLDKQKKSADAAVLYDEVAKAKIPTNDTANTTNFQASIYYNKGVAMAKDHKLAEAITAFKQSLRLIPEDQKTRENLQKALNEQKEQEQNEHNNNQQQKNDPPPSPRSQEQQNNKMNEKQAEEMLGKLRDSENQLQKQLQKKPSNKQNQKDW
ncbi:Tetratricopeptide repeat-containing protein [Filimonas lacunae]|uniref:Tetratricopeptide repeat-containing protein n=1 Tax=Filimonas lacunae TaxID=477680 RepID=A0A173MNJ2_9BACT|nr:tetratricopeptide repeat protein [Filimonas lacunae]BAV09213.1 BatC protein [Filimonas lacunae]SIS69059.1 Tetratricopeptide repeat-containing protein [Filimonas lacunae]